MADPLESARAKIKRAGEHLGRFHDESESFLQSDPHTVTHETNRNKTEHVFRFHVVREPPLDLSLVAGDAIQNSRAALDHMVFALAHHESPVPLTDDEARRLQFPICDSPTAFQGAIQQGRLKGIQNAAFIESLQPYPGKEWRLGWLRELSNIDKHRQLHVLVASLDQAAVDIEPEGVTHRSAWMSNRLADGDPILILTLSEPCEKADVKLHPLRFALAFEELIVYPHQVFPVEDTLRFVLAWVDAVVTSEFARRFA